MLHDVQRDEFVSLLRDAIDDVGFEIYLDNGLDGPGDRGPWNEWWADYYHKVAVRRRQVYFREVVDKIPEGGVLTSDELWYLLDRMEVTREDVQEIPGTPDDLRRWIAVDAWGLFYSLNYLGGANN